ncbi:hypothetical protein IVG45_01675 [Methylomonas sp. LL1]|uniref:hypothetical protein n=1 Tax=Methylomonas sp. LL1 TaxID=2785785 RepID=UPI0018C438DE|nr:hypothetical protein [Methylomonas sp. LL1]QPK63714.1 hypothetical protein IVG45_01675 [Methylomonas sp. LL1]
MQINISRIKAIRPWLAEARYTWFSVGVILVALIISLRPNTPEPVIRITGLALQILGIATVIWGISETRVLFGQPSFVAKAKSWLTGFPLLRRQYTATVSGSGFLTTGKARAHSTHNPGTNPTIEDRIASLERNITLIHERITGTEKEMDDEFRKVSDALKNEERERQSEVDSLHSKLEATGTGGVHISAIGASWLFVGVTLSTAALEISEFLK